jgi:hypothetical protein
VSGVKQHCGHCKKQIGPIATRYYAGLRKPFCSLVCVKAAWRANLKLPQRPQLEKVLPKEPRDD